MTATIYRMRPLTWVLLALLATLLAVLYLPTLMRVDHDTMQTLGTGLALVVLLVGMFMIRHMTQRLARLAAVAEAIGAGDYASRAEDGHGDAIGLLARAINGMAERIQQAVGQLERQQAELESNRYQLEEQNSKLTQEYQRQARFGDFLESLNTVDVNTLGQKALDFILRSSDAQLGQIYVREERAGKLIKLSESGIDRAALRAFAGGNPEEGLPGEVLARKSLITIQDIDPQAFPAINLGFTSVQLRCVLGLPILFQDRALGVVLIGLLALPDETRLRVLQNAIDALGSALSNALTYKTVQQQALRLEQANQELLEADRLRSEFVANMSHELRTPLNSIIGFSSVLLKNREGTLNDKDLGYIERINRNGKHLLGLINDILDLSKIEAGRMELEFRPLSLAALARETVDMLHAQAEARHLKLALEVEAELPEIETDGDKLRQVLINLIGNALKFTEQGGVTVALRRVGDEAVALDVRDTGIGIPAEKLDLIFEPFRQADSGTTRKYGGTGLGLTITRSIVEMLGGRIGVQSRLGEGSTFTVLLPLTTQAAPGAISAAPPVAALAEPAAEPAPLAAAIPLPRPQGSRVVLVVDDDADARELMANYIRDLGGQPVTTGDGQQALILARQYHPDLITLDLMMPGMDGWEVLRRLKGDPELCQIPVVIISIVADRRRALVLGAMDALSKPIAQDDLLAILRRSLQTDHQGRILVVDDNHEVHELFKTLLTGEVQEIRTASNGKEALEVLNHYEPDLIFLDLMMPEMDGLTFLRVLRTDRRLMNLPVVVVTAKQLSPAERRELEMRVVQVIQKGDDTLEGRLREVLESALRERHAA
ncbi:MAG TPA: response regulator [Candidatus Competibacteraceae bacterium]|nr:response regulator [Candidatus Competibacteraceae bacterium]